MDIYYIIILLYFIFILFYNYQKILKKRESCFITSQILIFRWCFYTIFWLFLHHQFIFSACHTIYHLVTIKMYFFTLTNYAVDAFTHPPFKKLTFSPIFHDFSRFSLMVSTLHLHFSLLLVTIIKCKKMYSKKNTKNREKSFQHSILFFENGQK